MPFTDRDLEQWKKSLSGEGLTFAVSRNDLEGLFERLDAAEACVEVMQDCSECQSWDPSIKALKRWRQSANR